MKNKIIIILLLIILLSFVGNIIFLCQDTFNGTYYAKRYDGTTIKLKFDDNFFVFDPQSEEGGVDNLTWAGYYFYEDFSGDETRKIYLYGNGTTLIDRLDRKSIFHLSGEEKRAFDSNEILQDPEYICYSAIAIQALWILVDIVLIVFFIKKAKKVYGGLPRLRIVIDSTRENQSS